MRPQSIARAEKRPLRFDDEVHFIRSWIEKPLATGAVMPSAACWRAPWRAMSIPIRRARSIELGPGTGPVTAGAGRARDRSGAAGAGRIQSDVLPHAARALSGGDGGAGRRLPAAPSARDVRCASRPAAIVSGLPLVTKPLRTRVRLISDAMTLLRAGAPFVQFTYAMVPPIPKGLAGVRAEASRADLDEPAAGAGVGLSRALLPLSRLATRLAVALDRSHGQSRRSSSCRARLRTGSHNARLAALAVKELTLDRRRSRRASRSTIIRCRSTTRTTKSKSGPPHERGQAQADDGARIRASSSPAPEHNASIPPLLKNAIDWVSRVRERGEPAFSAFRDRVFAIAVGVDPNSTAACAGCRRCAGFWSSAAARW